MRSDSRQEFFRKLSGELRSETFKKTYDELKKGSSAIGRYPAVESLIGMLRATRGVPYEEKDEALHALITIYRKDQWVKPAVLTLLLVALWPALEHIYFKVVRFSDVLADLFSEVHWAFLAELENLHIEKKRKIAINLQMNTEKRVRRSIKLEFRYQNFNKAYAILDPNLDEFLNEDDPGDRYQALREMIERVPEKDWCFFIRSRMPATNNLSLSEIDRSELAEALNGLPIFDLVTAEQKQVIQRHIIDGEPMVDIARDIGLTSGATRARFFRARNRIFSLVNQKTSRNA